MALENQTGKPSVPPLLHHVMLRAIPPSLPREDLLSGNDNGRVFRFKAWPGLGREGEKTGSHQRSPSEFGARVEAHPGFENRADNRRFWSFSRQLRYGHGYETSYYRRRGWGSGQETDR